MEKLCPETTFSRNGRPYCGKNTLILVLSLIILALVTVNILLLTRSNMHFDRSLCEDISTFQTNDGTTGGFKRTTFESDCSDTPCLNEATCHESITCDCMPGYEGTYCQTDIDECASQPCWNGGTCYDEVDFFICYCMPGYEGILCETDINECVSEPCLHGGTCYDGVNAFTCDCMPGYEGNLCQTDTNECLSEPCFHGATCYDGVDDFTCDCLPGYEGTRCEIDIDECASSPCQNGGTCNDDINSYWCSCDIGYTGTHCEAKSYLVMLGGEGPSGNTLSACDVYEMSGSSNDENTIPPLPEPREWAGVVDTDDSIYIIGGYDADYEDTTYKLTKSTKTWTMLSSINQSRQLHKAVEVNNKIVVVAGWNSGQYLSSVEIYDVATNIWRELDQDSDYPVGVYGPASCSWRNEVYVSGGISDTGPQVGVYSFSLETERWTWFANLVHARRYHSMVVVDDQLYVLDGDGTNQIEVYDESTGRFTVIANNPLSISRTNAVVLGSNIIIAGGDSNDKLISFDTITRNFTIRDMDLRREYHQSHVAMITI